jgi:hypothetical protein
METTSNEKEKLENLKNTLQSFYLLKSNGKYYAKQGKRRGSNAEFTKHTVVYCTEENAIDSLMKKNVRSQIVANSFDFSEFEVVKVKIKIEEVINE